MKKGEVGICIQTFIAGASPGVLKFAADNRTFSSSGGTYRTNDSFIVGSSGTRDVSSGVGKTGGVLPGIGTPQHTSTSSGGTTTVNATTNSRTLSPYPPFNINYNLTVTVDGDGGVQVTGTHDGYPSYEVWAYRDGQDPELVYKHEEGTVDKLAGCCDVQAK